MGSSDKERMGMRQRVSKSWVENTQIHHFPGEIPQTKNQIPAEVPSKSIINHRIKDLSSQPLALALHGEFSARFHSSPSLTARHSFAAAARGDLIGGDSPEITTTWIIIPGISR